MSHSASEDVSGGKVWTDHNQGAGRERNIAHIQGLGPGEWDEIRDCKGISKLSCCDECSCDVFQVMEVDRMIQDIVVEHEGAEYRYRDVCARWGGQCRYVVQSRNVNQEP